MARKNTNKLQVQKGRENPQEFPGWSSDLFGEFWDLNPKWRHFTFPIKIHGTDIFRWHFTVRLRDFWGTSQEDLSHRYHLLGVMHLAPQQVMLSFPTKIAVLSQSLSFRAKKHKQTLPADVNLQLQRWKLVQLESDTFGAQVVGCSGRSFLFQLGKNFSTVGGWTSPVEQLSFFPASLWQAVWGNLERVHEWLRLGSGYNNFESHHISQTCTCRNQCIRWYYCLLPRCSRAARSSRAARTTIARQDCSFLLSSSPLALPAMHRFWGMKN